MDSIQKEALIDAQRQWIKFRDKEIALIDVTYGKAQGTMWLVVRISEILEITKQRVINLESLLNTLDDLK